MNIIAATPQPQPFTCEIRHEGQAASAPTSHSKGSKFGDHGSEIGLIVVAVLLFLLGFSKGGT